MHLLPPSTTPRPSCFIPACSHPRREMEEGRGADPRCAHESPILQSGVGFDIQSRRFWKREQELHERSARRRSQEESPKHGPPSLDDGNVERVPPPQGSRGYLLGIEANALLAWVMERAWPQSLPSTHRLALPPSLATQLDRIALHKALSSLPIFYTTSLYLFEWQPSYRPHQRSTSPSTIPPFPNHTSSASLYHAPPPTAPHLRQFASSYVYTRRGRESWGRVSSLTRSRFGNAWLRV